MLQVALDRQQHTPGLCCHSALLAEAVDALMTRPDNPACQFGPARDARNLGTALGRSTNFSSTATFVFSRQETHNAHGPAHARTPWLRCA